VGKELLSDIDMQTLTSCAGDRNDPFGVNDKKCPNKKLQYRTTLFLPNGTYIISSTVQGSPRS
jgi:hypothetical protein